MLVTLYQEITSCVKDIISREYKIQCEIDFLPQTFWVSCYIESEILSSYYDVESQEMAVLLREFTPTTNSFNDFCKELEDGGWEEI